MGRKAHLRRVDAVAREYGIDRIEFGDYLHACKEAGDKGTANDLGDFSLEELRIKAQ